jgi:holo-[acyl-carrier protein] synthase
MTTNLIGIGVDMESVARFERHLQQNDQAFFNRLFHPEEMAYCQQQPNPSVHFAARFCAKEALVKATSGVTACRLTDFAIGRTDQGAPYVFFWQRAEQHQEIFADFGFMVSLTHTSTTAMAYVALVQQRNVS